LVFLCPETTGSADMSKAKELLTLIDKLKLEDKAALLRERFKDKPDFTISDIVHP
jgi:hypothetical protein